MYLKKRSKKIIVLIFIKFVLVYNICCNYILNYFRNDIVDEMKDFDYPNGRYGIAAKNLNELTIETGGTPIRNLIVSTWRSGSTFLGEILNTVPGTYYHYEPFMHYEIVQIRGPPNDDIAIKEIKKFFNCDYSDMKNFFEYGSNNFFTFSPNTRLWNKCISHPNFCFRRIFLEPICKLFPIQSMKLIRIRMNIAAKLLEDQSLNLRIVLLVRDPRGVMESRKHVEWCPDFPDCGDSKNVCSDMISDYKVAKNLIKKYPMTFKIVRYEDLSLSPESTVRDILRFYGLPFTDKIAQHLQTHTKKFEGSVYSTYRDSKSTPFNWMKKSSFNEIEIIQNNCKMAMNLWGYKEISDFSELSKNFNSVLPFDAQSIINSE